MSKIKTHPMYLVVNKKGVITMTVSKPNKKGDD